MEYSKIIVEAESRFSNPRTQNFFLRWNMIEYIQKEWSLEVYEKLIRTCKYFYASQPWLILDFTQENYYFSRTLKQGLEKNLKIWITGNQEKSSPGLTSFVGLFHLTSEDKFSQLLHSVRFSSLENLIIENRKFPYSDYIVISEFKSFKTFYLRNTNVTIENNGNNICLLDDLLKPLKSVERFRFGSENGNNYYLESAKRLADFTVPKNLYELIICEIPEYISFEYFYLFLKKNPSITFLGLYFKIADPNNIFINDIQSFYSENFIYQTSISIPQIEFKILIGNIKIHASFYEICKNCNQGIANKRLFKLLCPSKVEHWICNPCYGTFQRGVPCPFCLAGI